MTPIYGFVRLPGVETSELVVERRRLLAFAQENEFRLAELFIVRRPGEGLSVWREMLARCRVSKIRNIVIPSLEHLHPATEMASDMRDILAKSIQGEVWVLDEPREMHTEQTEQPGVMAG
ncbi:hypothetical protein ACFCYI_34185 [Streptomyces sp. NPDC056257]|uniref:hypothetical protein n=1 Tax=Streptomyces sp. NPDC056257 TaxID=3345765 RepID=UPI0035D6DA06